MANQVDLLMVMNGHLGKRQGIHVKYLAVKLDATERAVRKLIEEARKSNMPICGTPENGYYLASCQAELDESIAFLESRAQTSLDLAACLRKARLPIPGEQLSLV